MRKKKTLSILLALCMVLSLAPSSSTQAATKKKKTELSSKTITLKEGQKKTLKFKNYKPITKAKIKKVKWTTSNKKIAEVGKVKGKYKTQATVTAKKEGKATIKLKYNGKTYKCSVIVQDKVTTQSTTEEKTTATTGTDEVANKNKEEKTTETVSSEQPTTEATTSTEATKDTPKPEVPADVEDKLSEDTSEETTEETTEKTTEETPEEPEKPFDKENTYLTLASYENDYGYDTYHTDDEIFKNEADENHLYSAPNFSYAKTTTNEDVAKRFLFTFNVKHSFVKDVNPSIGYVNAKKAWIYDKNRTMEFKITNEWPNAEAITKDYISNFVKINATNLQTGEEVENPFVEKVVNYLEVANSIYLEFTEGYYYKVTLNDALLERKNGKLYTKDLEYYFIVTNSLEKINKPIFPEQIKVDVKERLDEDGNTRIDYRVPFTEEVLQTYNKWEYANVTFSNKDIPSYSSIIVKNISDANVYWEMPEYEQVEPDKWKVIGKFGSFYPQLDKYGVLTAKESEFLKELQEQKYRLLVTDTFGYFHTINYEYK